MRETPDRIDTMPNGLRVRLLEWTGPTHHWSAHEADQPSGYMDRIGFGPTPEAATADLVAKLTKEALR